MKGGSEQSDLELTLRGEGAGEGVRRGAGPAEKLPWAVRTRLRGRRGQRWRLGPGLRALLTFENDFAVLEQCTHGEPYVGVLKFKDKRR